MGTGSVTYVLNKGQSTHSGGAGTYSKSQTNTSINPVITNTLVGSASDETFTCYEIRTDEASTSLHTDSSALNRELPDSATILDFLESPESTSGYRLKLPPAETLTMVANYDYFVVIFSDDDVSASNLNVLKNKTHIAKITQQIQIDDVNDGIEFSPAIPYDLLEGTKFQIFKGPHTTNDTSVVAVAYGLLGNTTSGDTDRRYDLYAVASRPIFYFYNDRLEIDNQLNYSTKYILHRRLYDGDEVDYTISMFLTQSLGGNIIKDKSPYTYSTEIVDRLLIADRTVTDSGNLTKEYNNTSFADEYDSYTFAHTVWRDTFRNGLRCINNLTGTSGTRTGVSRYITHVSSPEKTNIFPFLLDMNVFNTISKSGSYAEARFADPQKIMDMKLELYDSFKVRDILFSEDLNNDADAQLPGTAYYESASVVRIKGLGSKQSLAHISSEPNYLVDASGNKEVIKINNYYYKISTVGSLTFEASSELYIQDLTVSHYREENNISWTSGALQDTTKITNTKYYRRKWSSITDNLLVEFNLNSNYASSIQLILKDREYSGTRITLSEINEDRNLIVPNNIPVTLYQPSASSTYLNYFSGYFLVDKLIFNGYIEYMEDYFEHGQLKYLISGRDNIHKLLGPVVNKNYLHAADYVYSTDSPIQQMILTDVKFSNTAIGSTTATVNDGSDHLATAGWQAKNNKIYRSDGALLGVVKTVSGATVTFYEPTRIGYLNSQGFLYINTLLNTTNDCDYIMSGLGLITNKENYGSDNIRYSSGKGIYFTSGLSLTNSDLTTASATSGVYSLGYNINAIRGISVDNPFLFRLANEDTTNTYYQVKTVSALTNYDIVNISTTKDKTSTIILAPVSPFILARTDSNDEDTTYSNTTGMYFLNTQSLNEGGLINLVNSKTSTSENSKKKPVIWKEDNDYFGTPLFRYFNLHKGGKGALARYYMSGSFTSGASTYKTYSEAYSKSGVGACSGYALAYRFKEGFTSGNSPAIIPALLECPDIFTTGTVTSHHSRYTPVSNRGYAPTLGSNWADYNLYDPTKSNTQPLISAKHTADDPDEIQSFTSDSLGVLTDGSYSFCLPRGKYFSGITSDDNFITNLRGKLEITDPKITQYHIFAPCDIYTDSLNNQNHIGYSTSDFNFKDFGIFLEAKSSLKQNTIIHENYIGGANTVQRSNTDYASYPISSSSISPQNIKRFSIGRLVECGFDILFNPIDVENFENSNIEIGNYNNTDYSINTAWHEQYENVSKIQYKKIRLAEKTPIRVQESVELNEEYITVDEAAWFIEPTFSFSGGKRPDFLDYLFNDKGHFLGIVKSHHSSVIDNGVEAAGAFNPSVNLSNYMVNIPTGLTSTSGLTIPFISGITSSGSGTSVTLNISEINGSISGLSVLIVGSGYVAGDTITVSTTALNAQFGGTASSNLVIRIPTDIIRLYTYANSGSDFPNLIGFGAVTASDTGDKGLEFNAHLRDPMQFLNYTSWGFNTHPTGSGAVDATNVTGAMTTMASGEYIYAMRYNNDEWFHDITQSYNLMSHFKSPNQPKNSGKYNLFNFIIHDRTPALLYDKDDELIYHEFGEYQTSNYDILGEFDDFTNHNVGDSYEYTVVNSDDALSDAKPRIWTPLIFSNHNLYVVDNGDLSAPQTGHPLIARGGKYTRYSPFNSASDFRGYGNATLQGHESVIGAVKASAPAITLATAAIVKGASNVVLAVADSTGICSDTSTAAPNSFGRALAVWNGTNTPRFLGYMTTRPSTTSITILKSKTNVVIGDTIALLNCCDYNYYHPNRIMAMISPTFLNHYGCLSGDNETFRRDANAPLNPLKVGLGGGPFVGGHFVILQNNERRGSELPNYTAGASFRLDIINQTRIEYNYSGSTGGWDGQSDQIADNYYYSGSHPVVPMEGWARLEFRGSDKDFGQYKVEGSRSNIEHNHMAVAAVFKPILRISTTSGSSCMTNFTEVSDAADDIRTITISFDGENDDGNGWNTWVTFTPNLTGYYLVSNETKTGSTSQYLPSMMQDYQPTNTSDMAVEPVVTIETEIGEINDSELSVPKYIHQILNHTVEWNSNGTQKHILTIDNATNISDAEANFTKNVGEYRLMKFADKCFYDFTPNSIDLYTMSTHTTKHPTKKEMWTTIPHLNIGDVELEDDLDRESHGGIGAGSEEMAITLARGQRSMETEGRSRHNEGFNSMYVLLDPEPETSNYVLIRDIDEMVGPDKKWLPNVQMGTVLNDGNNIIHNDIMFSLSDLNNDRKNYTLQISEIKEMVGLVSVGETFVLEVGTEILLDAKTCKIGTTYNIGMEVDNIINDLMEINNIEYTTSSQTQKYIASPNIKGADLYNALTFVSNFKGLEPRVIDNNISIKLIDDSSDITNITIKEGESNVIISKRNKSSFDIFNNVIIYGDGVRGIKKDGQSIRKIGIKTLEETDLSLSTQREVDTRASELLKLHTSGTNQVELDVGSLDLEYLEVGKIINVDYPSEHIPVGKYIILEINYSIGKALNLVLGYFTKNLDYRIAELIASGKKVNANLRGDRYDAFVESEEYISNIKIKELRIEIIQNKAGSSGFQQYLGFNSPIGLNTILGFKDINGTTSTLIYEEELP